MNEKQEALNLANHMVYEFIRVIKPLPAEARRKAMSFQDLVEASLVDQEKFVDPFYSSDAIINFWQDEEISETEQDVRRELVESEINKLLISKGIIGTHVRISSLTDRVASSFVAAVENIQDAHQAYKALELAWHELGISEQYLRKVKHDCEDKKQEMEIEEIIQSLMQLKWQVDQQRGNVWRLMLK